MYILTYDISNPKRLRKISDICVRYLYRVQKSVYEGDLSKSELFILQKKLKKEMNKNEDSIFLYFITRSSMKKKIELGIKKQDPFTILNP